MENSFTPDEKSMALFTALVALTKTLSDSGALDRTQWLKELSLARGWLIANNDTSIGAFDQLIEMLADL